MRNGFRFLAVAAICLLMAGCASTLPASSLNNLKVGMKKPQVEAILGKPARTLKVVNTEMATYMMSDSFSGLPNPENPRPHFVRYVDGKVASFGRFGDFRTSSDEILARKMEKVRVGMTRREVWILLGKPNQIKTKRPIQFFNYITYDSEFYRGQAVKGSPDIFYVKLVDGKVESFGRVSDYRNSRQKTENREDVNQ